MTDPLDYTIFAATGEAVYTKLPGWLPIWVVTQSKRIAIPFEKGGALPVSPENLPVFQLAGSACGESFHQRPHWLTRSLE